MLYSFLGHSNDNSLSISINFFHQCLSKKKWQKVSIHVLFLSFYPKTILLKIIRIFWPFANQCWYKKDEDKRYCGYQKRAGAYNYYHAPMVPTKETTRYNKKRFKSIVRSAGLTHTFIQLVNCDNLSETLVGNEQGKIAGNLTLFFTDRNISNIKINLIRAKKEFVGQVNFKSWGERLAE